MTEPWSPETAQAPAAAPWRDPAAWREDPSGAAQAAAADAKTTVQATAAQAKATAQVTVAQVSSQAQTMLSDFETRTADRPEIRVATVFAAGLLGAMILRHLAR